MYNIIIYYIRFFYVSRITPTLLNGRTSMALSFQNWLRSAHVAPLPRVLKRYEAGVSLQQSWMKVGKCVQFNEDDVFYSNFIKCWAFVYLFFAWWGAEVPKFKGDFLATHMGLATPQWNRRGWRGPACYGGISHGEIISVRQSRCPKGSRESNWGPCCLTAVVCKLFSGSIRDLMQTWKDLQSCKL